MGLIMSDNTLTDLMNSVNSYKSGAQAATEQILGITGKQEELAQASVDTLQTSAQDSSTVEAAKQAAELRTQNARVASANAFHSNINDVGEQITKYAAMADSAQQAKDDALAEIARKDSVTIFDNPLEYIMNKFTINADIAKHNDANAMLHSADDRIQSMNQNTQTTIATQNAITEPITAASAEAATRNAAVKATIDANTMAEKGLQYNLQGIQAVQAASKEDLNNSFSLYNAKKAEEGQKIALAHLALSQQEFKFRQQEYAERESDKADQAAYAQSLVDSVNRGRLARLGPGNQLDDLTGKMLLASLKGKNPLSAQMQADLDIGERSKIAGVNMLGATPAQATSVLRNLPVKLSPAQESVKTLLATSANAVTDAIHKPPDPKNPNPLLDSLYQSKDKEQVNEVLNRVAQAKLNAYGLHVKPGDPDNPLNIGSLNVLADNFPEIQKLPVYQKVLKPLMGTGNDMSDPNKVLEVIGDAVAKGTITHDQALESATIFQTGVRNNLATRNFSGFGLIPPQTYITPVTIDPSKFGGVTKSIDWTQKDQISAALLAKQSAVLVKQFAAQGKLEQYQP